MHASSYTPSPFITFIDLKSGPKWGGLNNEGTILTLYGKRFGSSRGSSTVTVGGGRVAAYLLWSDTKIAVAIGSGANTGNVVVRTSGGTSNGWWFTVRPGNIYCVSTGGNDAHRGRFPSSCWRTIVKAKNTMAAGDITYVLNGVTQTSLDGAKAALEITTSGTASMPIALVAYPGAKVSIGILTWGNRSNPTRDGVHALYSKHWVIAGMFIQGIQAFDFTGNDQDWRVVANEITCPNGSAEMARPYTADVGYEGYGCVVSTNLSGFAFYGNYVFNTGTNCSAGLRINGGNGNDACKAYHAVYFSTDSDHIDMAWNTIAPNGGCRALQFYSTDGVDQYALSVHDNVIHNSVCDAVNFGTVNPSEGAVQAYDNVIYNAGQGPDPGGEFADYACFYSADSTNAGGRGAGIIDVFNNTLYNCGARRSYSSSGAFVKAGGDSSLTMRLRNNIAYQIPGENYLAGPAAQFTGTRNLWYGAGRAPDPAKLTYSLNVNPDFVDLAEYNFDLLPGSLAIRAGVFISGVVMNLNGMILSPSRPDIGAY